MSDPKIGKVPNSLNSYDKEAIRLIDHCLLVLPVIRKRLLDGIEQMDVGIKAQSFDEPISISGVHIDPVGEIAVDPRRSKRRGNIKKTREAVKRLHKAVMSALDSATEAGL
jgi:hypothetical protein